MKLLEEEAKREMEEILDSFLKKLQTKLVNFLPQFEAFNSSVLNESREKNLKQLNYLNEELEKADEKIEKLKLKNERLRKSIPETSKRGSIDVSKLKIKKSELIQNMREILERTQHIVMIIVPTIIDLEDLEVHNVRVNVNRRIACSVDIENEDQLELLEELKNFVHIRNFEGRDRYVILRDSEKLLFAALGVNKDINLSFHTSDADHIKLFHSLASDAWVRSKEF